MNAQEFLDATYTAYKGKIQTRTPAFSTDKANLVIAIANRKISEWATDPRNKWSSLFETTQQNETGTVATAGTTALTGTGTFFLDYNVGDTILVDGETVRTIATITSNTALTVTVAFSTTDSDLTFTRNMILDTATQGYNLNRKYFLPSDYARVTKTDGSYIDYQIGKPQQRMVNSQSLYVHGLNPKKITFADTMDAGIDAGTLTVPGYYIPAGLSLSTDIVPVDDPQWLVYITASELARNDAAKDSEFPTLAGMANDLYTKMSNANSDVGFLQPNNVVNNMPQVSVDMDDWTV